MNETSLNNKIKELEAVVKNNNKIKKALNRSGKKRLFWYDKFTIRYLI